MSTLGDLSINAKITVTEDTAIRCIQLLNIFLDDNRHVSVEKTPCYDENGQQFNGVALCYNKVEGKA